MRGRREREIEKERQTDRDKERDEGKEGKRENRSVFKVKVE